MPRTSPSRPALAAALLLSLLALPVTATAAAADVVAAEPSRPPERAAAEGASPQAVPGPGPGRPQAPVPEPWRTVAERTGFRATSSYEETVDFVSRLAELSPAIHLTTFGVSAEGRPLPLVILSADGAFTPEAAHALAGERGKPIVLFQNGIHSGEIDGKDASLRMLRDVALGRRDDLLAAATLLVVPIYNVDGHERRSPFHRANQDGPVEGMGWRTTGNGLDLNRDHLKVASPEARAVIDLFNRWRPHLHVDNHVTDGSQHAWVLTWAVAEPPQLTPALGAWIEAHMKPALAATEAAGFPTGPYVELNDRLDPGEGFTTDISPPRFATGYYPLRHRPSVLVEMHSYKPYRERVLANQAFLEALLLEAGRGGRELIAAVAAAEAATVAAGRPDAEPSRVTLAFERAPEPERLEVPFHDWRVESSVALGAPMLVWGETPRPVEVDWYHGVVPAATASRPRGYLVMPGWPQIEERLAVHALRVERVTVPGQVAAEAVYVLEPDFAEAPYQGLTRVTPGRVERRPEPAAEVPAGALWIPADQPGFEVAVQLLEPEAPDSLLAWGLLNTVFERKEYIETWLLEPLVREMLADEAVAAEWRAALADEAFAADPGARWLWWYQRTPYWRDQSWRLPVLRVTAPPKLTTAPWQPVAAGPLPAASR
ncbi:MAG TPA: M14 family metallopeptidase [Thermoanaerobaculia bacterium]|nr:M14 family metallopeptidase [Thermoanaerobaculia bacterium]